MLEFNGTAIVLAISFVIFVILENFIFYKPLKKILDERENYIADNEKSLHPHDDSHSIMVYDIFNIFLDSDC